MSETWIAASAQLLGLGLLLGLLGGMLGIGGGLIAIPILALAYGMDQALAQGTALVMIVPNVAVGLWRYWQRHPMKPSQLVSMLLPAMVAARLSARLATTLDGGVLRLGFAMFLLVLTAVMLWQQRQLPRDEGAAPPLSPRLLPLVGLGSGLMSGMFTIGGGLVVVPALVMLFGLRQTAAQGMALAMVLPGSVVALVSYAQTGHVAWDVGLPLAVGGILTVSAGVALAHSLPPRVLRHAFYAVLLGTAAAMVV